MKPIKYIYILSALILLNMACKKSAVPGMHYAIPAPTALTVTNSIARQATINWSYPDSSATRFNFELSTSSSFATAGLVKQFTFDRSVNSVLLDSLKSLTPYFVRIQATNGDPLFTSAYSIVNFVSQEIESIFNSLLLTDVTTNTVNLSWRTPKAGSVTKIVLKPDGGTALPAVILTPTDIAAKKITISALLQATTYTAIIYENEENKGEITFTTRDPNAAITINRSSTIYETLQSAVDAAVSGDTINIGSGKYDFSAVATETVTITGKSLTIQPKVRSAVRPEIILKNIDLKGAISSFKVKGIKITSTSKANTATNTDYNKHIFGGTYLTSDITITLENCDMTGAESGLFFTQGANAASPPAPISGTGIFTMVIDSCLLHDFGNAGGDFIDFRSGSVGNITIKNTSIWESARSFFRTDATANIVAGAKVLIENCTMNTVGRGAAFIRISSPGSDVTLSKCIITNKPTANNNTISGAGTVLRTNTSNFFGTNVANFTNGIIVANNVGTTTLDPGYAAAATGDFTLGNATLKAAGLGDPRWIK